MNYIKSIEIDTTALEGSYLADLPVIKNFAGLPLDAPVTFLVGENGSGKSTLIEAIAVCAGFNPEGGSRNFAFSTYASHSPLHEHMTLVRNPVGKWRDGYFLRAESYYNVASHIEELDSAPGDPSPRVIESYGGRSLHEQSHGESFLALMRERLRGNGLYIFDEPEAALSPTRLLAMLCLMKKLAENHSQFIIATHSPILTAYPGAVIYEITSHGLQRREWRETSNVQLTRRFLANPEAFFRDLF